jgi:hypothetical protein
MTKIYPPIVTQEIPESVLTSALEYLGNLARSPRYPMPGGGYSLFRSRANAASIDSDVLRELFPTPPAGSGWEYGSVKEEPIAFGHHLILCPLDADGSNTPWLDQNNVPNRFSAGAALADAGEVAHWLVDYLNEQESISGTSMVWAKSIRCGDGHSARREWIHVHIVLTPCRAILNSVGLDVESAVDPIIGKFRCF